jgi:hypothetical protein
VFKTSTEKKMPALGKGVIAEKKVMSNLMQASQQWASRPQDSSKSNARFRSANNDTNRMFDLAGERRVKNSLTLAYSNPYANRANRTHFYMFSLFAIPAAIGKIVSVDSEPKNIMNANETLNQLSLKMARQLAAVQSANSYAVQVDGQKKHNERAASIPDLVGKMERGGLGPISQIRLVQAGFWVLTSAASPASIRVWKNN